ncbi:MAG: flagellar hook-associated protein FlgK [Mariprofundaceae bacterium]
MIFGGLNIAASSLKAQQSAMDVIAHNIANAGTAGYSRQTAELVSAVPERIGGLVFGRGVEIAGVRRIVDPVIHQAQLANSGLSSWWQEVASGLTGVESLFGSLTDTGLAASIDAFFTSWQQLANNPQDAALRSAVRQRGADLVTGIGGMRRQLVSAQAAADARIDQQITQANLLLDKIAGLTTQIQRLESVGNGAANPANDLRDQRDQAMRELAALIPVQQVNTADGGLLVQTPGGDLLTQDGVARHLARGGGAGGRTDIVIQESGTPVTGLDQGGSIGGLLALRDQYLGGYIGDLNSLAANLIHAVNSAHASGASSPGFVALQAGEAANPALPLTDPAQPSPFASQVQGGNLTIHVFDAAGQPAPPGGTTIAVTAGVTTMNDVATAINAIAGLTASVDASGRLSIQAAAGNHFSFGPDSSGVLAAYGINGFFQGHDAATLALSAAVEASADAIHTGQLDAASQIQPGDNTVALAILAAQNRPVSIDGSPAASPHERTSMLSARFGADAGTAAVQQQYRTAEAEALKSRREAVSGVNTDEEMIAMIQFQRAYEASAKVIQTSNRMLDALMGLIR